MRPLSTTAYPTVNPSATKDPIAVIRGQNPNASLRGTDARCLAGHSLAAPRPPAPPKVGGQGGARGRGRAFAKVGPQLHHTIDA